MGEGFTEEAQDPQNPVESEAQWCWWSRPVCWWGGGGRGGEGRLLPASGAEMLSQ